MELGGAAWWSQGSCWQKDHRQQAALAPGSWLTLGSWTESAALRAVAPGFPDHDPPVPVSSRWAVAGQRLPCPGKARQRAPSTLLSASLCGLTGGQWGNVPALSGVTLWDRNATSGHRVAQEPVVLESRCEAALKGGCGGQSLEQGFLGGPWTPTELASSQGFVGVGDLHHTQSASDLHALPG